MSEHWRDKMNARNQDWINSREKPKGGAWEGGKGSRNRVSNTDAYRDNWQKIFGGSNKEEEDENGTSDN